MADEEKAEKKPYRVYVQSYDGTPSGTSITTEDGSRIMATSAIIYMDAGSLHQIDLNIAAIALDVKATVGEVTQHCPICSFETKHECNKDATL